MCVVEPPVPSHQERPYYSNTCCTNTEVSSTSLPYTPLYDPSHFIELSCLRTFAVASYKLPSYKLLPEKARGLVSIKDIGQKARKIA